MAMSVSWAVTSNGKEEIDGRRGEDIGKYGVVQESGLLLWDLFIPMNTYNYTYMQMSTHTHIYIHTPMNECAQYIHIYTHMQVSAHTYIHAYIYK